MILDTCIVTVIIIIIIIIVTIATAAPNNNNKIALAVWAIIDMVLQLENTNCKMVAVGSTCDHGPPSASLGHHYGRKLTKLNILCLSQEKMWTNQCMFISFETF